MNVQQQDDAKGVSARDQLAQVQNWRFFVNLALMLLDAGTYIIAGAVVLLLRNDADAGLISQRFGFDFGVVAYLLVCAVFWVCSLRSVGLYHRHVMGDGYQINVLLVRGMVVCWVVQCAFDSVMNFGLTLTTLTFTVLAGWFLTLVQRIVSRWFITRSRKKGAYAYGTVIIGSPEGIADMLHYLGRRQQLNYRAIGVCPIRLDERSGSIAPSDEIDRVRVLLRKAGYEDLPIIPYSDHDLAVRMLRHGAQTVMVTDVLRRFSDEFNTLVMRMESMGLEIAMVTSPADVGGHETQVRSLQGTTIMTIGLPQFSYGHRIAKRIFDIVVSSVAIVLAAIPMICVAIAIKLDDHGPVFYKQERIGLHGRPFYMLKFRSMVVNADELKRKLAEETGQTDRFIFKMKNDPRITHVGHFLRRFSIDELPQFLNVFKGDMSVVGPRPPLPEEYARYNQVYATRMLVKPGITGPWQVSGRSDLSAEESEALDVAYVQDWSVMGDIVLLFRTVGAVVTHKGAY